MTAALRLLPWAGEGDRLLPALAEAAARTVAILTERPRPKPWGCYLACAGDTLVGTCSFKAEPDADGTVEIAYMTFPPHEGHGHATAMIRALLAIAGPGGASVVIAHTLPQWNASARALSRCGFDQADAFEDPEDGPVWYWERVLDPALSGARLAGPEEDA
jgi:RimJ/RimL family protein N-acetyltransferase